MSRVQDILKCFKSDSLDDIIFWAFRYFLGRMTIATWGFARDLATAYPFLSKKVRNAIKKELEEAFERDDAERAKKKEGEISWLPLGHDCDRQSWELVRSNWRTPGYYCKACAMPPHQCLCSHEED